MGRPKKQASHDLKSIESITAADLKKMSKHEKLDLLELLDEKTRRQRQKKDNYVPNPGQLEVHKCKKKIRVVLSGNGAGKTTMAVAEAVWSAQGYHPILKTHIPIPRRVIVLLDKPDKVQDKWIPEIRKWFDMSNMKKVKDGRPYVSRLLFKNGSEIKFMFHEQDPLSFESIECDDIICDEPPPRNVWIALIRGLREKNKNQRIIMVGTPLTGAWIRKEIYEPWVRGDRKDTHCFRFNTKINEDNLPDDYIQWFSQQLSERERKIRLGGEFFDLEGQALAHLFDRQVHIITKIKWDKGNPCVVSIDPHPEKPHVASMLGADRHDYFYYLKEISAKMAPRQFARLLKDWSKDFRVVDWVCDSLGSAAQTGGEGFKTFIQVLREEGIRVRATTYEEKGDDAFITRIQDSLLIPNEPNNFGQVIPKLRILSVNRGIINDIEQVQWVRDKKNDMNKPKLEIGNRDYLATLKYALATGLSFSSGKTKVYTREMPQTYGFNKKKKVTTFSEF